MSPTGAALTRWRKQRILAGVLTMVAGLGLMLLGAALVSGTHGVDVTDAAWIGSAGVLLIVIGAWLCRLGFAGPFPEHLSNGGAP